MCPLLLLYLTLHPECKVSSKLQIIFFVLTVQFFYADNNRPVCDCPEVCDRVEYTTSLSHAEWPSQYASAHYERIHGIPVKDQRYIRNDIVRPF